MKKVLFPILALVLALGLALVPANLARADYLPTMPPGTGNFGTFYSIKSTGPVYPASGYHWDDGTTPIVDERDIPAHYMMDGSGIHVPSTLGTAGAAAALDFHWVWVGATGDWVIWDMATAVHGVRVYPAQDHGPYIGQEFDEFDVLGSNDPTADVALWQSAVDFALYYDDINNIRTHDGIKDYTFGANSYRYIMVRTNALGGGDFEIDAVEGISVVSKVAFDLDPVPLGQEVSWTFYYTVTNLFDYTMTNIRVKDNFGANLYVENPKPLPGGFTTIDIQSVANALQTFGSYYDTFLAGWDSRFNAPTGTQTLGGVDFDIGEEIIILSGSESPASFPTTVKILVDEDADKVHFLGNVAGWSDVGSGTKIASYVINYGDATSETIDLIKDTNIDEWLTSVAAHSSTATTSVHSGVTGGSWQGGTEDWHLDLLTVDLGEVKDIESIDFTDAGNKAAPVLFAVTTEVTPNPSDGTLDLYERKVKNPNMKARSIQYRFLWDGFELAPGESATLVLIVSTSTNPALKQEFTSEGWHVLNSGANVKWIDDQDFQQSAVSGSIEVYAGTAP